MRAPLLAVAVALAVVVAACGTTAAPSVATGTLTLILRAGPVCPVEQNPPDPACAPRPVVQSVVALVEGDREVTRGTSDANGRISFTVPYGRYTVRPISDGGFPTPPADLIVDVGGVPVELDLDYDTGIR